MGSGPLGDLGAQELMVLVEEAPVGQQHGGDYPEGRPGRDEPGSAAPHRSGPDGASAANYYRVHFHDQYDQGNDWKLTVILGCSLANRASWVSMTTSIPASRTAEYFTVTGPPEVAAQLATRDKFAAPVRGIELATLLVVRGSSGLAPSG